MGITESHKRTSSDATPRPSASSSRFLNPSATDQESRSALSTEVFGSSKRLGYLADKISQSLSGTGNPQLKHNPSNSLLHPNSHSKAEPSNPTSSASQSSSPAPMASSSSLANAAKSHTSPSKSSYGRTYDSKLVTREMHRLNHGHLPSGLAQQPSIAPSVSSLALPTGPAGMSQVNVSSTNTDPWSTLHVHVLPLFNGEGLKVNIEDLNGLVRRHISTVVSSSPARALVILENDASELIASGMVTLNAKLMNVDDEKLVGRVVETWGFFWDQILTYVEAVLLPLQIDPLLSSLSRAPKTHPRGNASSSQNTPSSVTSSHLAGPSIDVRTIALRAFRDRVVYPLYQRLYARLSLPNRQDVFQETGSYQQPRLQQMLLVLSAQGRQRPVTFSLTAPAPQPTAGEAAVAGLLRLVRDPHPHFDARQQPFKVNPRTPSFLSGGLPRDRRGRIAGKTNGVPESLNMPGSHDDSNDFDVGDEPPQSGASYMELEISREKERELLDSLRSPASPETYTSKSTMSGNTPTPWPVNSEGTFGTEALPDMDQAQADLENYMASMNSVIDASRMRDR